MKVDGQCHCGAIAFQAEVDPEKVEACHCTDCQTLSGTAFRVTVPAKDRHFSLLKGELKTYIKEADTGKKRVLMFCPNCGASIYSTELSEGPKDLYIRVGTLRQRDRLPPNIQYWTQSALPWIFSIADIPTVDKQ
jgi:hypothetical protein